MPELKETYDEKGRVNVDPALFADPSPKEETVETKPEETSETPDTTPETNETKPEEGTDVPVEDAKHKESPETQNEQEGTAPQTTEPKLYAGKYRTVDELKRAYQNLGGDPTRFDNDKALEEAYQYRNAEYTRVQQENAERERTIAAMEARKKAERNPDQVVEEMLGKIDWNQVTDAQTLTKQLLPIILQNIPQGQATMDEGQLVEKIIPIIQEREQKQAALAAMEREVPRLTTDPAFRKAYALHVAGGRKDGTPYPRTKEGLQEAMRDFQAFAKSLLTETQKQQEQQDRAKAAALQPSGGGMDIKGKKTDEADDIIAAYAAKQRRLGFS